MINEVLPLVLKLEGGYVNNPNDPGGETNKGVTQKVYNKFRKVWKNSPQSVRYITDDEVKRIYESIWRDSKADVFCTTHPKTAITHFDFTVNAGKLQAAKVLQRSIGGLLVDGIIGTKTLAGLGLSLDESLFNDYQDARIKFYRELTVTKPILKEFLKGWLWRVKHVTDYANRRPPFHQPTV